MLEWFAMGGYGAYLWPAYAIALGALGLILVSALRAHGAAVDAETEARSSAERPEHR